MLLKLADVEEQYNKDKSLKKDDVKQLLEWAKCQAHLPQINELQAILFLHSCYYSNEAAKRTVDEFFTMKTAYPDLFKNRDPSLEPIQAILNSMLMSTLPKKTPENYTVFLAKFNENSADQFNFNAAIKTFDLVSMLHFHTNGTSDGFVVMVDFQNVTLSHVAKLGILSMKRIIFYLQETMPVRLKGLHFFNIPPFIDTVVNLMKPFMKKELFDMFHLHPSVKELTKFVPLECLPKDYGGTVASLEDLQAQIKKKLADNNDFFKWEETFSVDESLRKEKRINHDLGLDGTFKKLDID